MTRSSTGDASATTSPCLSPETIERLNHLIVAEGHRLVPAAAEAVRGDSFVVATDIHYPTDSGLIGDGLRTIVATARRLAGLLGQGGWRQHRHLLRTVKKHLRVINRIAAGKGRDFRKRLQDAYRALFDAADRILARATELLDPALIVIGPGPAATTIERLRTKLIDFLNMTIHACDQARRRVLAEEPVANDEKLFSLFEPQTQLIKRGKVPQPVEFGHRVLVIEDGAGFVCHYAILPHGAEDREVVVGEMRQVQQRLGGRIRSASFDRGFHSPENQRELAKLVAQPCVPVTGRIQAERQERAGDGGIPPCAAAASGDRVGDRCVAVGQRPGPVPGPLLRGILPVRGPGGPGSESSRAGQAVDRARGPEVCGGSVAAWSRRPPEAVGTARRSGGTTALPPWCEVGAPRGWPIRVVGRWNWACNRRKGDRNRSGIGQVTDLPPAIPKRWAFFRRPLASRIRQQNPLLLTPRFRHHQRPDHHGGRRLGPALHPDRRALLHRPRHPALPRQRPRRHDHRPGLPDRRRGRGERSSTATRTSTTRGSSGHSYVGEWVNLGAITSNSDLRNDYGEVSVPLAGDLVATGQTKVGCFIGDHTRTGLGSMLNTGTAIGVMCNVLPAGPLLPKHVPSFTAVLYGRVPPASRSISCSRRPGS